MMSILGSLAVAILNALTCLKRSKTVVCTQAGRRLILPTGSHGLRLTAPCSYNIREKKKGKAWKKGEMLSGMRIV